jgi:hypothetical protein
MRELGEIAAGEDEAKPTLHLKVALILICSRMHAASAPIRRGDALDTDPSVRVSCVRVI